MSGTSAFYEDLSADYDRFVDWETRLTFELGFLLEEIGKAKSGAGRAQRRVLDVACGTGHHAIAFAQAGHAVTAVDAEPAMVARARDNVRAANVEVAVHTAGFGGLAASVPGPFDAITCLGNSLPHLLTVQALDVALADMAAVLNPGGVLIVQNRNFDGVLARQERFMQPEAHSTPDGEWLFFRFYDWEPETLRFNMVRLHKSGDEPWTSQVRQTRLRPRRAKELTAAFGRAGLTVRRTLGSYRGELFGDTSTDLVLVADLA